MDPDIFDYKTTERTFRILASDVVLGRLWLEMYSLLKKCAPGINLHAVPYTFARQDKMLINAEVDLVLGGFDSSSDSINARHVMDSYYICVMRPDNPLAAADMTATEFAGAEHLQVSFSGDSFDFVDEKLQILGLSRRIVMTVNNFSSVAPLLIATDLIAVLPAGAVYEYIMDGKLSASRCPIELPVPPLFMLWHKRQGNDLGLQWLMQNIEQNYVESGKIKLEKLNHSIHPSES